MVGVAQLAEHRVVIPGVAGSSPVTHPKHRLAATPGWCSISLIFA